jgi:hypothetical protein
MRSVIDIPAKRGTAALKKLLGSDPRHKFLHPKPVELMELLFGSMAYSDPLVWTPSQAQTSGSR